MSDRKCVLSSCCCGCTLRTGAWVTSILVLIGSIINASNAIYDAVKGHNNGSWFNAVISIIMLVIAIFLMHGVRTENPRLIWIWVYTQIVLVILTLIGLIIGVIGTLNIIGLIIGLVIIGFFVYFILVVRSYAIELEGGSTGNTV